jgi:hypothetical protein
MNMYAYVGNDPVNSVDPSGMEEEVIVTCDCKAAQTALGQAFVRGMQNAQDNARSVAVWKLTGEKVGMVAAISNAFNESSEAPYEDETPDDKPEDFEDAGESVGKKSKPKRKKSDGSIWEKEPGNPHGGSKWKRWPNKRDWSKNKNKESVRPNGSVR